MEMLLIVLLIAAAAAIVLGKPRGRKASAEPALSAPVPVPSEQNTLQEELKMRAAEFMAFDRFSLVIQPVMNFATGIPDGGEVLSRLNHPEKGVIFPDDFLPAINAAGLYPRFDCYIFQKTCAWLSRSAGTGEMRGCVSCNFSRKTLSEPEIAARLAEIADSYGLRHDSLAIEITERERETDALRFRENLKQLKAAGFRLFLDDYGNGVTSLKEIMEYPLDVVKIDRSILYAAVTDREKEAYKALVATATAQGMKVVCEGIETEAQDAFARDCGCHYGQGFLYFYPTGVNEMFEMMERSRISEAEA